MPLVVYRPAKYKCSSVERVVLGPASTPCSIKHKSFVTSGRHPTACLTRNAWTDAISLWNRSPPVRRQPIAQLLDGVQAFATPSLPDGVAGSGIVMATTR